MRRLSTRQREVLLWLWAYPQVEIKTPFFDGPHEAHHGPPTWTQWWSNAAVRGPFDPSMMRLDLEGSPPKTAPATFRILRTNGLIYICRELPRARARMSKRLKLSDRYWTIGIQGMLAIGIGADRILKELTKEYSISTRNDLAKGKQR